MILHGRDLIIPKICAAASPCMSVSHVYASKQWKRPEKTLLMSTNGRQRKQSSRKWSIAPRQAVSMLLLPNAAVPFAAHVVQASKTTRAKHTQPNGRKCKTNTTGSARRKPTSATRQRELRPVLELQTQTFWRPILDSYSTVQLYHFRKIPGSAFKLRERR